MSQARLLSLVRPAAHPAAVLVIYLLAATLCVLGLAGYVVGSQADRLVEAARRDPLTGLHNSRFFHERLEQELARAVRYRQAFAVLMADVDSLKQINDRHGHRVGSMALIKTARAIASEMRSSDIAARWGGDEFGVLAPNTDAAAARVLADESSKAKPSRVRQSVRQSGCRSASLPSSRTSPRLRRRMGSFNPPIARCTTRSGPVGGAFRLRST